MYDFAIWIAIENIATFTIHQTALIGSLNRHLVAVPGLVAISEHHVDTIDRVNNLNERLPVQMCIIMDLYTQDALKRLG